jgi:chromosome partitioning protein
MRTLAVLNQKGGVGKTTTVANTAAALATAGSRVVAIDLDPQAHLTIHLGLEPQIVEAGSYKVLTQSAQFEEQIMLVRPNLWLLPANINLVGAESELVSVVGRETILREALESSADKFDYCLIDCAPSLGLLTLNALAAAEEVLIPLQPHFLALQGFGQLLQTVDLVNKRINPNLRVKGILLCMFDTRASLPNEVRADIEQFLKDARGTNSAWSEAQILPTFIRRNIKLAEAPSYGKTIFEYEQNCHGAEDYQKVAEFVHAQFQPPAQIEMQPPAASAEIHNQADVPESSAPEIQPPESEEKSEEPLAAPEPVSQPGLESEPQMPVQPSSEPAGENLDEEKPPFEIRTIPQSESQPPTEFTPSNMDQNLPDTGHREY